MFETLMIIGAIFLAVFFYGAAIFNKLVSLKHRYINAFSQIEVQLKRRFDLIPNLVETAKGYLKHEKETFVSVVNARNQAVSDLEKAAKDPSDPDAMKALMDGQNALNKSLSKLSVVFEDYPELKASENMMQLTEELTTTENKVSFARQAYNDQATEYNIYKQSFPPVILAPIFGHAKDATLLAFEDSAAIQEAPKVSF